MTWTSRGDEQSKVILCARMWIEMFPHESWRCSHRVILCARMWIEIKRHVRSQWVWFWSSFVRGCGLKYHKASMKMDCDGSSFVRGCGLKCLRFSCGRFLPCVILCARMWIEMQLWRVFIGGNIVILCARMWIEMTFAASTPPHALSHPLCEDVDWNDPAYRRQNIGYCHPLCEDVDWNVNTTNRPLTTFMSSFVRGCGLK